MRLISLITCYDEYSMNNLWYKTTTANFIKAYHDAQ